MNPLRRVLLRGMISLILAGLAIGQAIAAEEPVFDVPRLDGITIDGDAADWGERGFRVGPLMTLDGIIRPSDNYDSRFRLGWNAEGMLFLGFVRDSFIEEEEKISQLGGRDAVELFMAVKRGVPGMYQMQIAPGADPKYGKARWYCYDYRANKAELPEPTMTVEGKATQDGYVLEALLPWKNLGVTAETGLEVGMQVWMTDSDSRGDWFRTLWFPAPFAGSRTDNVHRIRLSDRTSAPVQASVSGRYERFRRARLDVAAIAELAGKRVQIKEGRKTLASGKLTRESDLRSSTRFILPMPPAGKPYGEFAVLVDGKRVGTVKLPADVEAQMAKEMMFLCPSFRPSVFTGNGFPQCEFENPQLVEDLIGTYTIRTTFYNAEYNQVTRAEKSGRYGAVIEIIPDNGGRSYRRFRTVYRAPDGINWWKMLDGITIPLPVEMAVPEELVRERAGEFNWMMTRRFLDSFHRDSDFAALFASMQEDQPGADEDDWFTLAGMAADRRYWVGLKRKLYGNDVRFPDPLVAPKPKEGKPAPVVREGTLAEAGMKPDTREKLDALCREWAENSEEAFATCVVRRGVIVFHQAYGTRDEKAMTVDTPSYMASNTKFLAGALMMMAVDQGLVDLDDPVAKFLPPFKDVRVKTPLTVRHLYTHTNGGWDHWGDWNNDLEEMIGWYYPHLEVGVRSSYNGNGFALAGKIVEAVSGEPLTEAYRNHLLEPLGCTGTVVNGTGGDARSIPLDMAKIAQLVLNKGAYGDKCFFSEDTWAKMMPTKLTMIFGPDTEATCGIGCVSWGGPGLSTNCIGHGASSAATLILDFDNELVIIMTRNAGGANHGKYHPQFIKTITDGFAE